MFPSAYKTEHIISAILLECKVETAFSNIFNLIADLHIIDLAIILRKNKNQRRHQ